MGAGFFERPAGHCQQARDAVQVDQDAEDMAAEVHCQIAPPRQPRGQIATGAKNLGRLAGDHAQLARQGREASAGRPSGARQARWTAKAIPAAIPVAGMLTTMPAIETAIMMTMQACAIVVRGWPPVMQCTPARKAAPRDPPPRCRDRRAACRAGRGRASWRSSCLTSADILGKQAADAMVFHYSELYVNKWNRRGESSCVF